MHQLKTVIPVAVASNAGAFLLFAFVPQVSLISLFLIAVLVPNVSMQLGSVVIMNIFDAKGNVEIKNIWTYTDTLISGGNEFNPGLSALCSFISGSFYFLISVYLEEVLPKPYGIT